MSGFQQQPAPPQTAFQQQQQVPYQQQHPQGVMMMGGQGGDGGGMLLQPQQAMVAAQQQQQQQVQQAAAVATMLQQQQQQQEKINRELFVGNTPPGTSEQLLQHFVNAAMRRVGLCQQYETPVLNVRVNNKFAFIELMNAEKANAALNLNGIPFVGGSFLKVSRPSKYSGPQYPVKTWQQLTGQALPVDATIDADQEKIRRELFIGNTTPEMTETMLKEFLGNAMVQVGLTAPSYPVGSNPITTCRVSGKFAFIELRSPQEAANALNLNNIPFMGTALRVGRPSKYNGPPDQHGNWEDILAKYMSGELTLPSQQQQQQQQQVNANNANTMAMSLQQQQQPQPPQQQQQLLMTTTANDNHPPSRVVELQHMLANEDLANDEEYNDILEDTREECSQFGQLVSVVIPKANEIGATKIFLEYATQQDAAKAIQGLQGRTFDGRRVQASYFDEVKYSSKDYS